jgi:hypothetical protein
MKWENDEFKEMKYFIFDNLITAISDYEERPFNLKISDISEVVDELFVNLLKKHEQNNEKS